MPILLIIFQFVDEVTLVVDESMREGLTDLFLERGSYVFGPVKFVHVGAVCLRKDFILPYWQEEAGGLG